MTVVTASQLRQDVYRLLDEVLATGEPLEIRRNGRTLRVVSDHPASRIDYIRPNLDLIVGDAEDLVGPTPTDWDADGTLNP